MVVAHDGSFSHSQLARVAFTHAHKSLARDQLYRLECWSPGSTRTRKYDITAHTRLYTQENMSQKTVSSAKTP